MRDAVKGYLTLAAGLSEVTRQRATAAARALVAQGEATAEQVGSLVEELLTQSRQNREAVAALVTYEVDRTLGRIGLASDDEVAGLLGRVQALEAEVAALRDELRGRGTPDATTPAGKSAGKAAGKPAGGAAKAAAKPTRKPARKATSSATSAQAASSRAQASPSPEELRPVDAGKSS